MSKFDHEIARENKQSRSVIQAFGNDFLSAFGIQLGQIVERTPTEIVNLLKQKVWIEELFRLEDDSFHCFSKFNPHILI